LRKVLPADLQIEHASGNPGKQPWQMEGQLVSRRNSGTAGDARFYEAITAINKDEQAEFDRIKAESEAERKKTADELEIILLAGGLINKCFKDKREHAATSMAMHIAEKDPETARSVLEKVIGTGKGREKGEIGYLAAKLGDTEIAEQIIEELLAGHRWGLERDNDEKMAAKIALILGNKKIAKQVVDSHFKKGEKRREEFGFLAAKIGDGEHAREAIDLLFFEDSYRNSKYIVEIALTIADKRPRIANKTMYKFFAKGQRDEAIEIAIKLGKKKIVEQEIQDLIAKGHHHSAAEIAAKFGEKELAAQELKKANQERSDYSLVSDAILFGDTEAMKKRLRGYYNRKEDYQDESVAKELVSKIPADAESLKLLKSIDKFKTGEFGRTIAVELLRSGTDLSALQKEFLPRYASLKEQAINENNEMDQSKKWQNPEDFFDSHNGDIARLALIGNEKSFQLMNSLTSRGLSYAEANLDLYKKALHNEELSGCIKKAMQTQNLDSKELGDLLEIASAYESMQFSQDFLQLVESNKGSFLELKKELNKKLLSDVAKKLGIETEISEQEVKAWKIKYFQNLVTNGEMLKNDENGTALYKGILKACFEGKFPDFISSLDQTDTTGKEIAEHNQKVQKDFEEAGVNWQAWDSFKETEKFEAETTIKNDREALFQQFYDRLVAWQEVVSIDHPSLKDALEKSMEELKKKKNKFDFSEVNTQDSSWIEKLLPSYAKTLAREKKKSEFTLSNNVLEAFGHLQEAIEPIVSTPVGEQTVEKSFEVKKWDRDPRKDLFQGNATHCCISVGVKETLPGGGVYGTHHPETILQYLIDKGINIAEVVDPESGDVIGQTWLFVAKNKEGKPILVADNFEVNNRYPVGSNVNRKMKDAMFKFLKKYAEASNISEVVLGTASTNDVETTGFPYTDITGIEKLGGYLNDKYYLEALLRNEAIVISQAA